MTVWFDVEDLFHYIRSENKRVSGIQRLTFEIYRAAQSVGGGEVRFVRHGAGPHALEPVEWAEIEAAFADGDEGAARAPPPALADMEARVEHRSALRRAARRAVEWLPDEVRRPLVLASVLQVQAAGSVARFGANLALAPARAAARWSRRQAASTAARVRGHGQVQRIASPLRFEDLAKPGDALLVLGSPWFRDYGPIARWLRDERRMRFGVLVHDLVPVRRPEWCHAGVTRTFGAWYSDVLPFCDVVLANSRHTAQDTEAFARERGIALPGPVRPVPVGTGFGAARDAGPVEGALAGREYVLFVSTMEARKNHALIVRVWQRLLAEVAAGARAENSVPDLVFAGRIGWLVADLVRQLENTRWLGGRVRMIQDPSDSELRSLYEGCLFTVFPSFYEGWGLPVTESLAFGKPCLSSNAAALPEAGGGLCRYFDPEDVGSAHRAVAAVLDDRPGLAAWQDQVRREFRPTPWTDTARAVLDAARLDG